MENTIALSETIEKEFRFPCSKKEIHYAKANPQQYTSACITFNKREDDELKILILPQLVNVKRARIKIARLFLFTGVVLDLLMKLFPSNVQLEWDFQQLIYDEIFSKIKQHEFIHLIKRIVLVTNTEVEAFFSELKNKTILETFSFELFSNQDFLSQKSAPPANEFIRVFSPSEFQSLKNLNLAFQQIKYLSSKELTHLGYLLSESLETLSSLSIDFSSSMLELKACGQFFTALAKEQKNNLKHFSFTSEVSFSENIIQSIGRFLNQYNNIEQIEFSNIQITNKALESLLKQLLNLSKLASITLNISNCEIKDGGLPHISEFMHASSSTLNTINLELNSKNYSEESLIQLGSTLKRIEKLKVLKLKIYGKILNGPSVKQLGEDIALCKYLQHLQVDFSFPGDSALVEWKSESDDSTIFELKQVKVKPNEYRFNNLGAKTMGYYSTFLINLAIVKANSQYNQISIKYPSFEGTRQSIVDLTREAFEQFAGTCKNLKSIELNTKEASNQELELTNRIISNNNSTLTFFELNGDMWESLKDTLASQPNNIVTYRQFCQTKKEKESDYFRLFPNLVILEIRLPYIDYNSRIRFSGRDIVNSNLTDLSHSNTMFQSDRSIFQSCMNTKRSVINSIYIFEKQISPYLLFHPSFSISDLWIND